MFSCLLYKIPMMCGVVSGGIPVWCGCCGVGAVKYRNRTEEHKSEAEKIAPPHNNTQNITDSIGIIFISCCLL